MGLATAACLVLACSVPVAPPPPEPVPPPAEPEPRVAPPCERIASLEVRKAERKLVAFCERGAVVEFRVALGRDPRGSKLRAGDRRTPEGTYRIAEAPRSSRYHRFILIDYPSRDDADAALREGRIDRADHARIVEARDAGLAPPQDTPLGGWIGIHGEGPDWRGRSAEFDWTLGCVALDDADMDFVADRVQVGVPVSIKP